MLLIGIEVKLYHGSASDGGQLSAYATMLSELVQDTAETDGVDASKVRGVLCYLVPDGSPGGRTMDKRTTSAILAWMIDPGGSHGWGSGFLRRLLDTWPDNEVIKEWKRRLPVCSSGTSEPCTVKVVADYPVACLGGERFTAIDVLVSLSHPEGKRLVIAVCLSIVPPAVEECGLPAMYKGLAAQLRRTRVAEQVAMIRVVPTLTGQALQSFVGIPEGVPKYELTWQGRFPSVETVLSAILRDERNAAIGPLAPDVLSLLMAFLVFVRSGFPRSPHRWSSSPVEVFEDYAVGIDGLLELGHERETALVGHQGGIQALKERYEGDPSSLLNYPFKWSDDGVRTASRSANWMPISDVLKMLTGT